jgi:hypothetical protein
VIGIGVQSSTSALLPPACDEFLFYDRLPGVEPTRAPVVRKGRGRSVRPVIAAALTPVVPAIEPPLVTPAPPEPPAPEPVVDDPQDEEQVETGTDREVGPLVTRTLAGLQRHTDGPVLASRLKRAILRKDPTFDEADHGFRGFGELLRNLQTRGVVELAQGSAQGDPEVMFPENGSADDDAFRLLADVVSELGSPQLSGLKDKIRKRQPGFSEKRFGFNSFLSFAKAARARDLIEMEWDDDSGDYRLHVLD